MRVLMVVRQFLPWVGGTERQAQRLAARLIEAGVDVGVVTGWWVWGTSRQEVIDSIPVSRNFTWWGMFGLKGLRKFGGYTYMLSLFWYLWKQRNRYDLIHIHMLSYPAFPGVLAGRWLGKKTIVKIANSGWGSDIRRMRNNDLLPGQRQMLPVALRADRIVAVNKRIVDELRQAGVPAERIAVIPNGVDVNGLGCRCDYGLTSPLVAVFVGRLHPQKGLDVLIAAFAEVVRSRPGIGWRLWLLGDGPSRPELETMAQQMGVAQDVKFWGQVDNVSTLLDRADIFVLPSRAEGMSNALLEAMAHGLPCVATRISGNTDLIQHGENGLLVQPESETALAEAMLNLADDEMLRRRVGRAARETVETGYSMDSIAQRYVELYDTLLRA
jgi:glycosyltransferase involved in cell wall biosynthesis